MKKSIFTLFWMSCFSIFTYSQSSVIYDANGADGGTPPTDPDTYLAGDTAMVMWEEPLTNTGYTFACWNTMPDGSGTNYSPDTYSAGPTLIFEDIDITLYAQWGHCTESHDVNYALRFNTGEFFGEQDVFESITVDTMPSFTDAITIEGWINPTAFDEVEAHNDPIILKFYNDDMFIGLKKIGDNHVLSWNGWAAYGETNILADEWTHFAVVLVGGTIEAMYINGAPETFTIDGEITMPTSELWVIGNMTWSASPYRWHGLIDELRVWTDARSSTEIANNYNKKLAGNEAGLFAYWDFDKGTTTQLLCDHNLNEFNHIGVLRNMEQEDWVTGVPLEPLAIEKEKQENLFSVYPNPTANYITINLTTNDFKNSYYTITNINGKTVKSEKISQPLTKVNLADLTTGIYFINIVSNSILQTKKISIQ